MQDQTVSNAPIPLRFNFQKSEAEETRKGKKVKVYTRTFMPELDRLFEYTPNIEQVQANPEVVYEALDYVIDEFQTKHTSYLNILNLYFNTEWVWKTNLGTLPKRISKWYHTHTKDDLSEKTLTRLGNLFRRQMPKTQQYLMDITKTFNWQDGDFADSGSCFWGTNAAARFKMEATPGYYAMRFFRLNDNTISLSNNETRTKVINLHGIKHWYLTKSTINDYLTTYKTYKGISRAWLFTDIWEKEVRKGVIVRSPIFIVFNGYGIQTNLIASILGEALGLPVRKLEVKNQGAFNNYLYVNDAGWLIGDPVVTEDVVSFDFDLKFK